MSKRLFARVAAFGLFVTAVACGGRVAPRPVAAPIPARAGSRTPGPPTNGLEVIGWMRYTHPSRALRSLAFTVETTDYRGDSAVSRRLRAYASLPGKHRVELLPSSGRNGYVRDRQHLAVFERGRRVASISRVDLAVLLAYDLFAQSVDTTIMWLDSARVRFGPVRRDRFEGRDVWVVGAADGDLTSSQFWVDADRWRLVRVIQPEPRAPNQISDIRFTEYVEVLDVPVPKQIEIYRAGRLQHRQTISDVSPNPTLSARAFDLTRWRDAGAR